MNMYVCLSCFLREVRALHAEAKRPFTEEDRESQVQGFTDAWRQGWMWSCPVLDVGYAYHEEKPNFAVFVPDEPPEGCKYVTEHVVGGKDDD